ncbi:hypothetical protein M426DRAFT_12339 [Hypoxylon sp. CI-4A]|nr:hypothetical protein M426DRAFT_12339 [Hypoxylon sp. CI-4A]
MFKSRPAPRGPVPFFYHNEAPPYIPDLDDEELDSLTAVLKALARGGYPRFESVPLALNAYNCNQIPDGTGEERPWAYFHPVTHITPMDVELREYPEIDIDHQIAMDLQKPWKSIRGGDQINAEEGQDEDAAGSHRRSSARTSNQPPAQYRFICFIHKHKINRRSSFQKGVHTISIWDREWDELTWHDTYHINREERRREIKRFWFYAWTPGMLGTTTATTATPTTPLSRDEFITSRIRYRTVYHIAERVESTTRDAVPPRHTLWAVMAAGLHHMNRARDPQVGVVPDRLEFFGGQGADLLPQLFVHLLLLCLEARPDWTRDEQEACVRQLRIPERLRWMRLRARAHLERFCPPASASSDGGGSAAGSRGGGGGGGSSSSDGGEDDDDEDPTKWLYDILKI